MSSLGNVKQAMKLLFWAELLYFLTDFWGDISSLFFNEESFNSSLATELLLASLILIFSLISFVLLCRSLYNAGQSNKFFKYAYYLIFVDFFIFAFSLIFSFYPDLLDFSSLISDILSDITNSSQVILICLGISECFREIDEKELADRGMKVSLMFVICCILGVAIRLFQSSGIKGNMLSTLLIFLVCDIVYLILQLLSYLRFIMYIWFAGKKI